MKVKKYWTRVQPFPFELKLGDQRFLYKSSKNLSLQAFQALLPPLWVFGTTSSTAEGMFGCSAVKVVLWEIYLFMKMNFAQKQLSVPLVWSLSMIKDQQPTWECPFGFSR